MKKSKSKKSKEKSKSFATLKKLVEKGHIPLKICYDPNEKNIVYIWEESPDGRYFKTEIDGDWKYIGDSALIYSRPSTGEFISKKQKEWIYASTARNMATCKSQKSKQTSEYITEKACPIKWWFELHTKKEIK